MGIKKGLVRVREKEKDGFKVRRGVGGYMCIFVCERGIEHVALCGWGRKRGVIGKWYKEFN